MAEPLATVASVSAGNNGSLYALIVTLFVSTGDRRAMYGPRADLRSRSALWAVPQIFSRRAGGSDQHVAHRRQQEGLPGPRGLLFHRGLC